MNEIEIEAIPCLKDNYAYLVSRSDSADAYVVDPSEAEPIVSALQRRGLTLRGILATHHHADHVGGVAELVARAGAARLFVAGHALDRDRIPEQTDFVDADHHIASREQWSFDAEQVNGTVGHDPRVATTVAHYIDHRDQ